MACETQTTTIGDKEYSVTQWPAEKALLMKFRLVRAFGAAFASLAGTLEGPTSTDNDMGKALASGLEEIFKCVKPEDLVALLKDSIVGVAVDGKKLTGPGFATEFSGDELGRMYAVFIFVLKVNYGNLIKGQWMESALARFTTQMKAQDKK